MTHPGRPALVTDAGIGSALTRRIAGEDSR